MVDVQGQRVRCEGPPEVADFEVDIIIFATGYRYLQCSLPFLQGDHRVRQQPRWKHVFPVNEAGRLAFVGYIRPYLTSIPMLIEMQSRLVAAVFAGRVCLPPERRMVWEEVQDRCTVAEPHNPPPTPVVMIYLAGITHHGW